MKNLDVDKKAPSSKLKHIIDAYWMVQNHTDESVFVPILPDGCVDIVMKNDEIFLVGVMEFASIKGMKHHDNYLGIRFKPGILASLFKQDIAQYNDTLTPLHTIDKDLASKLKTSDKDVSKLDKIFEYNVPRKND